MNRPAPYLVIALVLTAGCDRGPSRVHLSGQVVFNGQPVPAGEIYFDPDVSKGKDGPQGFARIVNGRYDTRDGGKPLTAGPHVVRILGFDAKARPEDDLPFGRRLFAEYTTAVNVSESSAAQDFEVSTKK